MEMIEKYILVLIKISLIQHLDLGLKLKKFLPCCYCLVKLILYNLYLIKQGFHRPPTTTTTIYYINII